MMARQGDGAAENGFTLVEVLAALLVFTIVTLGVIPLLIGSVRGAAVSRSFTVGKNVALEAMERSRGLPYYVDYPTQKSYSGGVAPFRKVDLLDLYYPSYAASGVYQTTCSASGSTDPACPRSLPPGYSIEFRARFVTPVAATVAGVPQESFTTKVAPAGFAWNPDPYASQDRAPSQTLELTVKSIWQYGGQSRSFEVSGLISDRAYGEVTVRAAGKIDYGIRVATVYTDGAGVKTRLDAIGGTAESRVETKSASNADQSAQAAELRLFDELSATELSNVDGAESFYHASPDCGPLPSSNCTSDSDPAKSLGTAAGMDATITKEIKASVTQDPLAEGAFSYSAPLGTERLLWVNGQVGDDNATELRLDNSQGLLTFRPRASKTFEGKTTATTAAVSSALRKVETTANLSFGRLRILPTTYINGINGTITDGLGVTSLEQPVVIVDDFAAAVSCRSTAATAGGNAAAASKSWSAKLYYYRDANNNGILDGSYRLVSLSSANASDPLSLISPSNNVLVYDGATNGQDVYLFEGPGKAGYLQTWSSVVGQNASVDGTGRVTQAGIDSAIRLTTAPTNPDETDSSLDIKVGKLSCESVDKR